MRFIFSLLRDKRGVSALEYAILAGLMVVGLSAAVGGSGVKTQLSSVFSKVGTELTSATQ
ncbi:MAG TPA: Flp family type IVb pilin [Candidatus Sulfotelmatobacter sp.]|jgi:pilus assembly protein Flp/PilA|nr:Flp family type IVb pilin [Candidatus Sulfotelmatobacter sp.]